ncbi:putative LPS assembly protein LptD [Geofilum sp. OHC36d9]|uniref:putative LPS assembly protein LptD n=1 Tax=Geofilum sp. OHC36d9 TaxID=3458413 RepID=UPI004033FED2
MRAGILSVLATWMAVAGPINGQTNELIQTENVTFSDSLATPSDSLSQPRDSTTAANKNTSSPFIDAEVKYSAKDSTLFDRGKVFLYGDASVSYRDILLTAYYIELDLDSNLAYAAGTRDSLGVEQGLPVFKDKGGEYTMRRLKYNFETEKAIIEHVVTEQGEGYIIGEKAKKNADNTYFLKDGRYTTCDNHDHPHFYINMTKAKVIPGDKVITGPAYLVVEDVKIFPLFVPFAFVPMTSSYHSGFLMPSYGEESTRGFFLKDGGYYFAFNDYFDMALTGDIYGNGSWGMRASSNYKKRYKFAGSFKFQHITNLTSEKDLPDFAKQQDMSLNWTHRQDPKANPNQTFSASVNYSTSSFDRNNVGSIINPEVLATNQKQSSVSYSRSFPNSPFNFSSTLRHSQNSKDSTISLTLPDVTLTMNRIYPFKQKNRLGKEKWYETIGFSYTGNMSNSISNAKESELSLTPKSLNDDWKNGVKHSIPVSMNLKLLKYFSLTPNVSYTERWYFKSISKQWDEDENKIVSKDTTSGFNRVYDYSFGVGTSTKIYTFFTPSRAIFGDKINTIRHVMTPSVSFSYRPDFSDPKYGFYDWFEYYNSTQDRVVKHEYSYYDGSLYGTAGKGKSGSMSIGLGNMLEMKVKSDRDSTGFKKVSILESLNFSTSYNFLADSLNLSNISMSGRTKIFGTSISFGATFDPYALDTIPTNTSTVSVYRSRHYEASKNSRLVRLQNANLSFGLNFDSKTFKKDKKETEEAAAPPDDPNYDPMFQDQMQNEHTQGSPMPDNVKAASMDDDGYTKFEMPWNVSINYSMRLVQSDFNKQKMAYDHDVTADINLSGRISLTPKWDISMSSGYDIIQKEIAHTNLRINRNLHCWSMSFNLVPIGNYKSFFFSIAVNSSLLRDLKYEKRSSARDNPGWN